MASNASLGTVGIVRPTQRPAGYDDLLRMLPAGVGVVPLCLDVRRGAVDEFRAAIVGYEVKVAELARLDVDVINPSGAPPFMVLGYRAEQDLIRKWERDYKTRVFTSGTSQIDALRALNVQRFLGVSYFGGDINGTFAQYSSTPASTASPRRAWTFPSPRCPSLRARTSPASSRIRSATTQAPRRSTCSAPPGAHSTSWSPERELGVPVIHAVPTQCWDIQRHLKLRVPVQGYGRLLAQMPDGVTMATRMVAQ
jgi:maleate cis-trans isomerase